MKLMKLNLLETHDRLLEFNKQADYISQGCDDCVKNRPKEFGCNPFYIFAHARTEDGGAVKRLIWSPRLTKPEAQVNSMLFKWTPPDLIKIIWMIPAPELWDQYSEGKMTHSDIILKSIHTYCNDRHSLEQPEEDDLPEDIVNLIYHEMAKNSRLR